MDTEVREGLTVAALKAVHAAFKSGRRVHPRPVSEFAPV